MDAPLGFAATVGDNPLLRSVRSEVSFCEIAAHVVVHGPDPLGGLERYVGEACAYNYHRANCPTPRKTYA